MLFTLKTVVLKAATRVTGLSFNKSCNHRFHQLYFCLANFSNMSSVKIGTHNGTFHCDEVLACSMLKILPRYKNATIIRTRDLSILDGCDVVVDVGGKYDPSNNRFDHHMREFSESLSSVMKKDGYDSTIKLSSAGLVYSHLGKEVIKQLAPELNEDDLEKVFKKVYETFIKEVDAIDNGVQMFAGEPCYTIWTDLCTRVSRLNVKWNTPHLKEEEQFQKAMAMVGEEFNQSVENAVDSWLPARSVVKKSIDQRFEVDPSGEIVELTQFVPWKEHLFNIESEDNINPTIKFIIFKDKSYRVQCVPVQSRSFQCRIPLPEEWAGLRDEQLSDVSKINNCVFVHSGRFIGGNETREGALKMAQQALKNK